jgi:hypothetical protein
MEGELHSLSLAVMKVKERVSAQKSSHDSMTHSLFYGGVTGSEE